MIFFLNKNVFIKNYIQAKIEADNTRMAEFFLNNLNIPGLTEKQRVSCEGKITSNECDKALETFQLHKAPGNDGIPIEFYRTSLASLSLGVQMSVSKKVKCQVPRSKQ